MTAVAPRLVAVPSLDDDAVVPCTSSKPCTAAATWVGTMSECRHTVTICDTHKLRVEFDSLVGAVLSWIHSPCQVSNSHITWTRL